MELEEGGSRHKTESRSKKPMRGTILERHWSDMLGRIMRGTRENCREMTTEEERATKLFP